MIKFLFVTIIIFTSSIFAQTNEEKGLSIVEKSIDLDKGFIDVSSEEANSAQNFILADPQESQDWSFLSK